MARRKRKRKQQPKSPLGRTLARNAKWIRRLAIAGGLIGVLAAIVFFADPFGGQPTAITADGEEVNAGVIEGRPNARPAPGNPAPNFLLPDYDRLAVRLDEFKGKAVFLNFWASWCGPCEREMPAIIDIAQRFPDDVVVLAVNRGEGKGTATGWTRAHRFPEDMDNFIWLLDPREDVVREYNVGGMPQSFFIDRTGIIRFHSQGALEFDRMVSNVEQTIYSSVPPPGTN